MANKLIPEELDSLIQEFLTDGVLTDKERQVILKKAVGMGLDQDMVDLYLDAQVQKIDQVADAAARRQKGKQCPYCGGVVPQLSDKCPHCERLITPEATEELKEILDNLEDALVEMKAGHNYATNKAVVERYARKARLYYSEHPKVKLLLFDVDEDLKHAEDNVLLAEKKEKRAERMSKLGELASKPVFWKALLVALGLIFNVVGMSLGFNGFGAMGSFMWLAGLTWIIVDLCRKKKRND